MNEINQIQPWSGRRCIDCLHTEAIDGSDAERLCRLEMNSGGVTAENTACVNWKYRCDFREQSCSTCMYLKPGVERINMSGAGKCLKFPETLFIWEADSRICSYWELGPEVELPVDNVRYPHKEVNDA